MTTEAEQMSTRYAKRAGKAHLYSAEDPFYRASRREWEDALRSWARAEYPDGLKDVRLLEVGCGHGKNLQFFLDQGCAPENVVGCDLLEARVEHTRRSLPGECRILAGDACALELPEADFDVALAATVFSSILDAKVRGALAEKMWSLVKPGGGILWYDFVYNNPANPDVRGVPLEKVRALFPAPPTTVRRLTLAPPIGRRVARIHPSLYAAFNLVPLLRTHLLCWIKKP
jgi:SAM-dependent methyltransferase